VTTRLGRRLPVDDDKVYSAVNYLIQSSATADVLKLKIAELAASGLEDYIRLPVHDEILFEVPDDEVADVLATINEIMPERQLFGDCHLEIDTDVLDRWGDHYR
jgi:DNA polymerase-1